MTCVVGLVDGVHAWLGSDAVGSDGWGVYTVRKDAKVFRSDHLLIGYTSSFRMGQILRYYLTVPGLPVRTDPFEYMVMSFMPEVRRLFKDFGYMKVENGKEEGGAFLVAFKGRLFEIGEDLQVGEPGENYAAVGGGSQIALGSLHTSRYWSNSENRVRAALRAAEAHMATVRGPFKIIHDPDVTASSPSVTLDTQATEEDQ